MRWLLAASLAATGAALAASTHEVKIQGVQFPPGTLQVQRGDTVTWRNDDVVPHTVTDPGKFDSGNIAPSKSYSHRFDAPGDYDYICSYHPGMKGRVEVK